ncbi:CRISPR-associated endonuclease/helicase Cas3 [Conexibacter arvalis]|uniref:CRISPR-associated endonuclease/helicase Cas3 n=2 Tax=Conexibacter arvalis TaxID=912552 RepID=A0A840IE81_9ACTN|nr:CRISPR-associated endonuclease/helicase Cas3 [Conexibacter arvalis]
MLERFRRFFAVTNGGARPYPWQEALLASIAASGRWPAAIAAPTGSGKSSVVDIHVFLVAERERARAAGRDTIARPPRRLVLVAPRRVLVEDQFLRAQQLAEAIARAEGASDPIVGEVADALRRLTTSEVDEAEQPSPLGVTRLRGGVRLDTRWRLDPAQCQVICATPQMWGSRLLGRGFRGSRLSRNLEMGLLGHDVAVVVDEAHLHGRLVETASKVASLSAPPIGLQVVAMSATPNGVAAAHGLTEADSADPELNRRVRARKRVELVEVDDWRRDAVPAIVEHAEAHRGLGTVGVFVNTVEMALHVAAKLDGEVELVCGRMRPADVAAMRDRRPGLLEPRGNADVDFLVSTQSLEVGVDLDLPAIVTAIAPAAALAQRAGRLNRGGRRDDAVLTVVAPRTLATAKPETLDRTFAPYTGADIVAAATWLAQLEGDASPARISATPLPRTGDALAVPALTGVELETAAMSSVVLAADIEPAFYVEEPTEQADRSISIAGREHLDLAPEVVRQALLAAPPRAHELAALSLDARRLIDAVVTAGDGSCWVMRSEQGRRSAERLAAPDDLAPGDTLIVPAASRICTAGVIGVPRGRPTPIGDVMRRRPDGLTPDAVVKLSRAEVEAAVGDLPLGGRKARGALASLVAAAGAHDVADALARLRLRDLAVTWCAVEEDEHGLLVAVATDHDGRLPAIGVGRDAVTLDAHGIEVEARLVRIVGALDLPSGALGVALEQLAQAARWHDEGKRHPRFQRRMGAPPDGPPLAKPAPGHVADRGDGWRHEQLSAAVAWANSDRDPVQAVIVAGHHGHGLPLFDRDPEAVLDGWGDCERAVRDALDELFGPFGVYERERLRLQRSLGVHRLAYLEALLRCADMQVSREGR